MDEYKRGDTVRIVKVDDALYRSWEGLVGTVVRVEARVHPYRVMVPEKDFDCGFEGHELESVDG